MRYEGSTPFNKSRNLDQQFNILTSIGNKTEANLRLSTSSSMSQIVKAVEARKQKNQVMLKISLLDKRDPARVSLIKEAENLGK